MKAKWKNVVKKTGIMILTIAAGALLAGCSSKLAAGFDEDSVKKSAQELIDHLTAGEYQEAVDMMSQTTQGALPVEDLSALMETAKEQTGAFQKYKSIAVVGQKDSSGTDCAVAVAAVSYEKGMVTYTISFNMDMEVIGLWMK